MSTLTARKPHTITETRRDWASMPRPERRRRVLELMQARNEPDDAGTYPAREALVALMTVHQHHTRGAPPSRHTVAAYRRAVLDLFEHWHAKEIRASDSSTSTWERPGVDAARDFAAHLGDPPHEGGRGLNVPTVRLKLSGVAAFYRSLVWANFTTAASSPWREAGMPADRTEPHEKRAAYSLREVEKLHTTAARLRDEAAAAGDTLEAERRHGDVLVILLGVHAGLRAAEMVGLSWSDVRLDADDPTLTVPATITRNGETVPVAKGQRPRSVPLTSALAEALRRSWRPSGEVLPYATTSRLYQRFAALARASGLERGIAGRGVHALRHTCAVRVYDVTRDLGVVQRTLGHKSVQTTTRYASANLAQLREGLTAAWG